MHVAPQVVLTDEQEQTLRQWARGRSLPARQVERARVVLMAAVGSEMLLTRKINLLRRACLDVKTER